MKLFNTMTRQKEEFVPLTPGEVKMYCCGPTVYNYIHVGNARPMILFDVLRRYLEYRGNKVTFVQNFTDVDDKIIKRANEEGTFPVTSQKISANTIACYARAAPKGTENRIEKTPPDPQGQEAMSTAVPLLFLTQRAGNGAKPEGICIPLAPGRTFPSLPAGRLAVGGRPSLSGSDRVLFPFHTR